MAKNFPAEVFITLEDEGSEYEFWSVHETTNGVDETVRAARYVLDAVGDITVETTRAFAAPAKRKAAK